LAGVSNRAGALAALLGPDTIAADVDPRRVVGGPAHNGGIAVAGQRDRNALLGVGSNRAGADQLALLGPDAAASDVDPRRPDLRIVARPAHDGGVTVGGQRDGVALAGSSNRVVGDDVA
jgi:hypothetical protein